MFRGLIPIGLIPIGLIVVLALVRCVCLFSASQGQRSMLTGVPVQLPDGIQAIRKQVFDPDAVVLLHVGDDGCPGRKNWDDDQDGAIDDSSEMGAYKSDDQCLASWQPGYAAVAKHPSSKVIYKGTFVDAGTVSADEIIAILNDPVPQDQSTRFIVHGESDGVAWTRLVQ